MANRNVVSDFGSHSKPLLLYYAVFGTCYSVLSKNSSPKMSRTFNYFMVITIGMRKVAECDINLDYTIDHLGDGGSLEHIFKGSVLI